MRKSNTCKDREATGDKTESGSGVPAPKPFAVVDGRISWLNRGTYLSLCDFDAWIEAEEVQEDGLDSVRVYRIRGVDRRERPLPAVEVRAEELAGMAWVARHWGARAIINSGMGEKDRLREAIQRLSEDVPSRTVYAHTGWIEIGGKHFYLTAGGAIGADGQTNEIEVSLPGKLKNFSLPPPPTGDALASAVRKSLHLLSVAPDSVTTPLLAMIYLAPLAPFVRPDFGVFLTGRTGTKKSELSALAQSHFGAAFERLELPCSWNATDNAIEKSAFLAKDTLLVVDDFCPRGPRADVDRMHSKADRVFRGQGNQSGRERLTRDMRLRPSYFPRGIILASGEDMPRGHSLRARVLTLEVEPGAVSNLVLSHLQGCARDGTLARAMSGYVAWIAKRYAELETDIPDELRRIRGELQTSDSHARTAHLSAALLLGVRCLGQFAVESAAVSALEWKELEARIKGGILEVAHGQARFQKTEDPAEQFLVLLQACVSSGRAHFASATSGGNPDSNGAWGWDQENRAKGDLVGWVSDQEIWLNPESSFRAVQLMLRDQSDSLAPSKATVWKRMVEKGMIIPETGGDHFTSKRMIPGHGRQRVLVIPRAKWAPLPSESGASGASVVNREAWDSLGSHVGLGTAPNAPEF